MRNLQFKYAKAENFLCYGPDGIELDLTTMGNILVVKGKNWHDVHPQTGSPGSNGTGKSALFGVFIYGLFGRLNRKVTQGDVVHKDLKKRLRVEVRWDQYRVVRTRKPDDLRLWDSPDGVWDDTTEISSGSGAPETQRKIEAILGMNFRTFVSVVMFDDRNDHCFLECDGPTKRVIVENLLSLDRYRDYSRLAKSTHAESVRTARSVADEYERMLWGVEAGQRRVEQICQQQRGWKSAQQAQVEDLEGRARDLSREMQATDAGAALAAYDRARDLIAQIDLRLAGDTEKQKVVADMVQDAVNNADRLRTKVFENEADLTRIRGQISEIEASREGIRRQIASLESLRPGVLCDRCYGEVKTENAVAAAASFRAEDTRLTMDLDHVRSNLKTKSVEVEGLRSRLAQGDSFSRAAREKQLEISRRITRDQQERVRLEIVPRPEVGRDLALLAQRVEDLKSQAGGRRRELSGPSPYDRILGDAKEEVADLQRECQAKRGEIEGAEANLPYLKFWVDAFGDDGIRKYVLDSVVPSINSQIEYWLQVLIYGHLKLTFDNTFEAKIERVPFDDDPFVYDVMSGGERGRMNLSIINSFAHIQMLDCGACPSVLFLDEVATNIDSNGKECVHDMIRELAATRQVFVTTHDPELLDLLQGCQSINLERRDGVTRLVDHAA